MSEYDKTHVAEILAGEGTYFTANLLRLISKADTNNRTKLFQGFPEEVNTVHVYQTGKPFA